MVTAEGMDVAAMLDERGERRAADAPASNVGRTPVVQHVGGAADWREPSLEVEDKEASIHLLASAFAADAGRAAAALDRLEPEHSVPHPESPHVAAARPTILLRRTADRVPIILGSVIGALRLVVFTIAAVFVRFAR